MMVVAMAGVAAVGLAEGTVWSTVSLKGAGFTSLRLCLLNFFVRHLRENMVVEYYDAQQQGREAGVR